MITIEDLIFTHAGGQEIFKGFGLSIGKGESWTIIGPSGCGKTTLLYLIAGLIMPQKGCIRIKGEPVTRPRPQTGLVLQDHGLLPWATVVENSMLGFKIRKFYGPDGIHSPLNSLPDRKKEKQQVDQWLARLGIDQYGQSYPAQLSRGQRQRAAIARTLVLAPDLLLMDEPFSALDAPIRKELQQVMNTLHEQTNRTSIVVTHDIEEAVIMGRYILVLSTGVNTAAQVIDNPHAGSRGNVKSQQFEQMCDRLHNCLGALQ
ncbi:ABC transporter ATP-binding protein [Desulfobacula sp.]|uniref:ABC transporter ATP-binding protein n=1 Tax=Desulfobacula sp. TaxID=2593537 RepID=UPI0026047DA9|nr:ABC transporter ATP-binding protein [Desulfobacula sp.]